MAILDVDFMVSNNCKWNIFQPSNQFKNFHINIITTPKNSLPYSYNTTAVNISQSSSLKTNKFWQICRKITYFQKFKLIIW